ncbi:MAG: DNA/RNA non-specific endonuclease [Taibaiella sp.]|nr:DNA/RNA non-specific endonuclease [Taibaiella sp.]
MSVLAFSNIGVLLLYSTQNKYFTKRMFLMATAIAAILNFSNCRKATNNDGVLLKTDSSVIVRSTAARAVYTGFPETFESGTKGAYTAGTVTLTTGVWNLSDALIGNSTTDRKNGSKSVRIQNTGTVTMNFDKTSGAYQVTVAHGVYGTDASSTWGLWYSTNSGSTWTQTGSNVTTSSTSLSTATFTMSLSGNVRFQLRKLTGGRLNIDDLTITDNVTTGGGADTTATRDDNMGMGNPSGATAVASNTNNYLMVKSQYALSYNNSKGMANWVSWHLSTAWKGSATRCDCFNQDGTLPSGFFRASSSNYTSTGFDRGHFCPSDDRDGSSTDNAATFLMSNISPQAPNMNQQTWEALEAYCRTLITQGKELYIIAGGYGSGGTGSAGGTTTSIASGSIKVPSRYWKVIVVLSKGTGDVARVDSSTRVIAIDMPNVQSVNSHTWDYYRTTTDAIESATGYDFLSNVSTTVQNSIESSVDSGPTR